MNEELSTEQFASLLKVLSSSKKKRVTAAIKVVRVGGMRRWKVIGRVRNHRRDRTFVMNKIENMDDDFFKKMYRLDRPTFQWLLEQLTPVLTKKGTRGGDSTLQGANSSDTFIYLSIDSVLNELLAFLFSVGGCSGVRSE